MTKQVKNTKEVHLLKAQESHLFFCNSSIEVNIII